MKKTIFLSLSLTFLSLAGFAFALNKSDIVHPVAELGGCMDEKECRAYCNNPDHITACLNFAERYNLMSVKEIRLARTMSSKVGPGGCRGEACKTYCDNPNNMKACLRFAVNNPEVMSALEEFEGEDPEEMGAVLNYLESGGRMPEGCTNKDNCMAACSDPSNIDVCMEMGLAIGTATGQIPPEHINNPAFKGMMRMMMTEGGPGGCRFDECDEVDEEDWMEWMMSKGLDPMDFAPPEARQEMQEGMQQMEMALAQAPPEVKQCIDEGLREEGLSLDQLRAGKGFKRGMEEIIPGIFEGCFESNFSGMMGGGMMGGYGEFDDYNDEYDDEYSDEESNDDNGFGANYEMPGGCPLGDVNCSIQYCMKNFSDPACKEAMKMMSERRPEASVIDVFLVGLRDLLGLD